MLHPACGIRAVLHRPENLCPGLAAHIDDLSSLEDVDFDLGADLKTFSLDTGGAKLPETTASLDARFGQR